MLELTRRQMIRGLGASIVAGAAASSLPFVPALLPDDVTGKWRAPAFLDMVTIPPSEHGYTITNNGDQLVLIGTGLWGRDIERHGYRLYPGQTLMLENLKQPIPVSKTALINRTELLVP